MKNYILKILTVLFMTAVMVIPQKGQSQTVVKIGEAEIVIQSPISINKKGDSLERQCDQDFSTHKFRARNIEEFYVGMGMVVPVDKNEYLPVYYGNSYNLEIGCRYLYRPCRGYAIGTLFQYTFYNYKLKGAAENGTFVTNVPGTVRSESFRTDNLGTGLFNRFYLFSLNHNPFMFDLGGYADFSYSKRYNVKTRENGDNNKHKYRDCSKFNPIQAGLYSAISRGDFTVYARYRLTNLFNPDEVPAELPRLSIGIQISLD